MPEFIGTIKSVRFDDESSAVISLEVPSSEFDEVVDVAALTKKVLNIKIEAAEKTTNE